MMIIYGFRYIQEILEYIPVNKERLMYLLNFYLLSNIILLFFRFDVMMK